MAIKMERMRITMRIFSLRDASWKDLLTLVKNYPNATMNFSSSDRDLLLRWEMRHMGRVKPARLTRIGSRRIPQGV